MRKKCAFKELERSRELIYCKFTAIEEEEEKIAQMKLMLLVESF